MYVCEVVGMFVVHHAVTTELIGIKWNNIIGYFLSEYHAR